MLRDFSCCITFVSVNNLGRVVQNLTKLLASIKISILKYGKYIDIFSEKNVGSFCIAKDAHIFAAKISMYLKIP